MDLILDFKVLCLSKQSDETIGGCICHSVATLSFNLICFCFLAACALLVTWCHLSRATCAISVKKWIVTSHLACFIWRRVNAWKLTSMPGNSLIFQSV